MAASVLSGAVEKSAVNVRRHGRLRFPPPWRRCRRSSRLHGFTRSSGGVSALPRNAVPVGIVAVVLAAAVTAFSGSIRTAITNIGTSVGNTTPPFTPDADPT